MNKILSAPGKGLMKNQRNKSKSSTYKISQFIVLPQRNLSKGFLQKHGG